MSKIFYCTIFLCGQHLKYIYFWLCLWRTVKNCKSYLLKIYCCQNNYIPFRYVQLLRYIYFSCLSVAYSERSGECRLSNKNQRESRILYDPEFDYYENIIGRYFFDYYQSSCVNINSANFWSAERISMRRLSHTITSSS